MDLARIVAPGQVEGIDIEETQIARAEAGALERGLTNVHFRVGTVYELPFTAGSFDVVVANTVMEHLNEPVRALREMRRVLAPGGIAAVRDEDWGATLLAPTTPSLELWPSLMIKVWTHNGGDPFLGRKHRQLLNAAGFSRTQTSTSTETYGSLDTTSTAALVMVEHHRAPEFAGVVLERAWADQSELDDMYRALGAWGQRDDAFFSLTFCETLAWKLQTESLAVPRTQ
jgi:SAM-dependent methyltransferase